MTPLRQRMLEELRRRYFSPATTRGYVHAVAQSAEYFNKSPELLRLEEIGQFQLHLLDEKKLALGTIALRIIVSPDRQPLVQESPPQVGCVFAHQSSQPNPKGVRAPKVIRVRGSLGPGRCVRAAVSPIGAGAS